MISGAFFEHGEMMRQGKRSDLEAIQLEIKSGATELEIANTHFSKWVLYRRSFKAYHNLLSIPRDFKTLVTIYWGKTGLGKTRKVFSDNVGKTIWTNGDFQWFDGYHGQEICLFDDFRGQYELALLLKLLDRYPMQVPVKGGFTNWRPKHVYITSNEDPKYWYFNSDKRSQAALFRRIEENIEVETPLFDDINIEPEEIINL